MEKLNNRCCINIMVVCLYSQNIYEEKDQAVEQNHGPSRDQVSTL